MNAAQLVIRCLEREAAAFVFGIPGEENLDFMDALLNSSLRFIPARHEQGAAFMANVQGRLTGTASVCLSTLGLARRVWSPGWRMPTWIARRW